MMDNIFAEEIAHAKTRIVLQKLVDNDLFLKPETCEFCVTGTEHLGFIIEEGKITMDPVKVKGSKGSQIGWHPEH
jgi:hypothetical protein